MYTEHLTGRAHTHIFIVHVSHFTHAYSAWLKVKRVRVIFSVSLPSRPLMSLLNVPHRPCSRVLSSPAGSVSRPSASSSSMERSCRENPSAPARWSEPGRMADPAKTPRHPGRPGYRPCGDQEGRPGLGTMSLGFSKTHVLRVGKSRNAARGSSTPIGWDSAPTTKRCTTSSGSRCNPPTTPQPRMILPPRGQGKGEAGSHSSLKTFVGPPVFGTPGGKTSQLDG